MIAGKIMAQDLRKPNISANETLHTKLGTFPDHILVFCLIRRGFGSGYGSERPDAGAKLRSARK